MRCSFCGTVFEKGRGKMYVKRDGGIYYFCSNKCEKNLLKLKRNPRNTGWTIAYHREKEAAKGGKKND